MLTTLNNLLNAHANAIAAITAMIVAIVYCLTAHAVNRNTYDRFANAIHAIARIVGVITCMILVAMALTNRKFITTMMLVPMAGFIMEYWRLGTLRDIAQQNGQNREEAAEREARRFPTVMAGMFTLLFAVSATSLWNTADVNGNAAERAIRTTSANNCVANCGEYQFVWTPYEIDAEGDAYDIPNTDQCRLYVYQNGKLIGTDVIQCTDIPNTTPFTDEVKIVGYHYDDVYFRCGNGMLYCFAPGTSFADNNDHIDAIGENIVSCDFFKGAYRYNDYRKTLEHRGWGDNEWAPTEDDIPFDVDAETISNFYSCQYM